MAHLRGSTVLRGSLRPPARGPDYERGARPCQASDPSVLRQTQHALADDVALNLARAPRDGVLTRADDTIVPARGVGHGRARPVDQHAGAQQLAGEVRDAHAELGAEQLENGALGPGRLAAELARYVAQPRVPKARGVDPELGEALTDQRVLPRGPAGDAQLGRQGPQPYQLLRIAPPAAGLALVHQRGHGRLPALVLPADQVLLRHADVDEEDLVEVAGGGHEDQRAPERERTRAGLQA